MEKLSSIIQKSALETYDLVEKNKKLIMGFIILFLPKETRDFILNKDFEFDTYYSKSELEAMTMDMDMDMDIENQTNQSKKKRKNKNIKQKKHNKQNKQNKYEVGLLNSINKPKVHFLLQYIPEQLLNFILFFSTKSLHSVLFYSFIIIFIFVTNINHLLITLLLLIINTITIIVFSNCPIHIIEKKYRNKLTDNQHFLCNIIKKNYDDNNDINYENTIEKLILAVFAIFIKINLIILYKVFQSIFLFTLSTLNS